MTSISIETESPQSIEKTPKPTILNKKVRTDPNRNAIHPVKGTQIASAIA
jgi:hypothetical protein